MKLTEQQRLDQSCTHKFDYLDRIAKARGSQAARQEALELLGVSTTYLAQQCGDRKVFEVLYNMADQLLESKKL
jgi:hypothetical protein